MHGWLTLWAGLGGRGAERGAHTWSGHGGLPQLLHRVGKEADAAAAGRPLLAQLRAVAAGVQPALEHAVGVGAGVAALAGALRAGQKTSGHAHI
jgi:hypothetical protein